MTWPSNSDTASLTQLTDLVTPMVVRVAATLRLADHIAAGTTAVGDLAEATGTDAGALGRVLRYLAVRGVFIEQPAGSGHYLLTGPAEFLLSEHSSDVQRMLDLTGGMGHADLSVVGLLDAVRTGEASYPAVHGTDLWTDFDRHPRYTASFDAVMSGRPVSPLPVLLTLDWADVRHLVDVGGGNGDTLTQIVQKQAAHLRGTIVERAHTASAAREAINAAGLDEQCAVVTGNFFDPLPAGADAYLLSMVLHDWLDDDAIRILGRCADAVAPGGRVLIGDLAATGEEDLEVFTHLDMRMLAYFGARERTVADFDRLAAAVGLRRHSLTRGHGPKAVLEYRKAA